MRDVYAWIDPLEEVARADWAEVRAARAYDDGASSVLKAISRSADFNQRLDAAIGYLAEKVAVEEVKPFMAKSYEDHERRKLEAERMRADLLESARGLQDHVVRRGEISTSWGRSLDGEDSHIRISHIVAEPYRKTVAVTLGLR